MFRVLILLCGLLAGASSASSQNAPTVQVDPRLAAPTIDALQSMLRLRSAELKTLSDDYEARLETAMEWLKEAQSANRKPE